MTFPKGTLSKRAAGWLVWPGSQRTAREHGKSRGHFLFVHRFKCAKHKAVKDV